MLNHGAYTINKPSKKILRQYYCPTVDSPAFDILDTETGAVQKIAIAELTNGFEDIEGLSHQEYLSIGLQWGTYFRQRNQS